MPIHMRNVYYHNQALHYHWAGFREARLTDDVAKVTCKTCLRMLKRAERYLSREGENKHVKKTNKGR